MPEEANPKSRKREPYTPDPKTLSLLRVSGNPINGLGETKVRRASPFFWHPPDQHPYGDLQMVARQNSRKCPGSTEAFAAAYNHPPLCPVAADRSSAPAEQLASEVKAFALAHEADAVGIAAMDPLYVFEGYTIEEPWVIVLALAHNYERLRQVPSDEQTALECATSATSMLAARAPPTRWPTGYARRDTTPRHSLAPWRTPCCSSRLQSRRA